ncbi:MAG: hypothetical protein EX271_13710, partial [Acidimicrobiales bacterium]
MGVEIVNNLEEIQQFIESNRSYFGQCKEEASDKPVFMLGFDNTSPKEAFEQVLEGEPYYLAQCLYHLFFGDWVAKNEQFALESFGSLSYDEQGQIINPTMAYFYAYCLNRNDELDKSQSILETLRKRDFAPAYVTNGDLYILNGNSED